MTELKPCPFCGGTDIRDKRVTAGHGDVATRLECQGCYAIGPTKGHPYGDRRVEQWNERAEP